MKQKICCLIIAVLSVGALLMSSCAREPSYEDRETFAPEVLTPVEGTEVVFADGLATAAFPVGEPVGDWLSGCSRPDRNDHFQAYTLRREIAEGENTTFTYLIYYPHGGDPLSVTPELTESGDSYLMNIRYDSGKGEQGYSLCRLEVSLPTQNAPRLRFRVGEEILDVLVTVTDMATL